MTIAPVVEGHGDAEALPVLLRRLAERWMPDVHLEVTRPVRVKRQRVVQANQLEQAVELALDNLGTRPGAVLVLLDSDDDCPAELGPSLLARTTDILGTVPGSVVLAKREFEAWFLAAADSLAGVHELGPDVKAPADAETVTSPKQWLEQHMPPDHSYSPTIDQPALAAQFDIEEAQRGSASLEKLIRDVDHLVERTG